MKPLGFLVSLLVHALFLLLLVAIRFPVIELYVEPQVIQVVPMSPPPAAGRPPQAPALVYVRPFVLPGGTKGLGRGPAGVGGGRSSPPAGAKVNQHMPPAATAPPRPGGTAAPAAGTGIALAPGRIREKLTIDLGRISLRLRERKMAGERSTPAAFAAGPPAAGLPFGDPAAGGRGEEFSPAGDGTSSYALGGSAFFDSRGYDITPWAKRMVYRVKKNWISPPVSQYGLQGVVGIYLLIGRDGSISSIHIRKASGIRPFDQAAFSAIELSAPLPPLPADYPADDLAVYLLFCYR